MPNLEQYKAAKEQLFDSLRVIDSYIDGLHKPQLLMTSDWTELESSPGVYIKNITLHQPSHFSLALVHGVVGAKDLHHRVADNVELHVITGRLALNQLEIKAGDRIKIPANINYSFEYLEDTYLTAKFTPIDSTSPTNFSKHGCELPETNLSITSEIEGRSDNYTN